MKKISVFLSILGVVFGLRYYWDFSQEKTSHEKKIELEELKKNSGASLVNYQYTIKEPKNTDFEIDSSEINYSESEEEIWKILKEARYTFENGFYQPIFSEEQNLLDGKKITLQGFMIPMQESTAQNFFLLSYFPYAMCFFCGNAEPQTVVEVYLQTAIAFQDEPFRVEGILKLNTQNPEHLFYRLEGARVLK